jgi:hypothetical protein
VLHTAAKYRGRQLLSRKRKIQNRLSGEDFDLERFFGCAFLAGCLASLKLQISLP